MVITGFPSLTPTAIQHLTVLASNQLHPSSELLKTWAALLASSGAKEQDVAHWIHHRNQEQQIQHFPTPSDTTMTPEPSATSQSPRQHTFPGVYKQETTTSPVMPALQLHPYEHASPSEPSPTSPSTSHNDHMLQLNKRPQLQAIVHGVRDALASPQTTSKEAPKTAAEFEAMFSPFEQRISLLLRALETT
ncbi:hypothetical protein BYT27DRAFT_7101482 [Phlegmacium glaucopus]|nr:hypothetical protein BYT27DRAFT_7101482 [Phlegmacium glaucopus]